MTEYVTQKDGTVRRTTTIAGLLDESMTTIFGRAKFDDGCREQYGVVQQGDYDDKWSVSMTGAQELAEAGIDIESLPIVTVWEAA